MENDLEAKLTGIFEKSIPYVNKILSHWKAVMVFNGIIAVLAVALLIFSSGREYTSMMVILPDYGNKVGLLAGLSGLSDIASMAGINVGSETPTAIYENLVKSEAILAPVVLAKYRTEKYKQPVNLIEYWDLRDQGWVPDSLQERYKLVRAIDKLTSFMRTDVERDTKILTVQLRMPEGSLVAEVINNVVESLDIYVRTKRKSNAVNQRKYIQLRMLEVGDSLELFEDDLAAFRTHNKVIDVSPELQLEQARLSRRVDIQQTVFMELQRQLELAKIEEIKDTPIINVREEAQNPVNPSSYSRKTKFLIIMFFSIILSSLYFLFQDELKIIKRLIVNWLAILKRGIKF